MREKNSLYHKPKFEINYNNFANTAQIQEFINKQLWTMGSEFNSVANGSADESVKWGGQSRFLCGFNFYAATPSAHRVSITLNNEKMIENVPLVFLQPNLNLRFIQYYEFIRPLSGSDTMVINLKSTVAEAVSYTLYMTRSYNQYYQRT